MSPARLALDILKRGIDIPLTAGLRVCSAGWRRHSRLILVSDTAAWVIDEEIRALKRMAATLGIRTAGRCWRAGSRHQSVFYGSQFYLLSDEWIRSTHRIGVAYFHGKPGTGAREFDELFDRVRRHRDRLARIQVSHSEMRDCILSAGVAPETVHLIPIGINLAHFRKQTPELRRQARTRFDIPQSAAVVGSFQKDGVGWKEGLEPKRIKGPDVFLQTLAQLKPRVPELFVVLSGPARGYVKAGLERLGIPYRHVLLPRYSDIGALYQALDVYLVTSRQEGGPKAVLESMACGVPLVTTRVGQAMDLVHHGENAYMTDVEDVDGLAHWAGLALGVPAGSPLADRARATAEANSYDRQAPLWDAFFRGFVERT